MYRCIEAIKSGAVHCPSKTLPALEIERDLGQHYKPDVVSVDLTGQDYDGAFVVVVDQDGNIVWDNRPEDIRGVYELTRGEPAGEVAIPAEAFPQVGAYLVGVAGIRTTTGREDLEGMNTVLSTMMAGQLKFEPLVVAP